MPYVPLTNFRRWSPSQKGWFAVWGIQDTSTGLWWSGDKWSDKPEDAEQFDNQKEAAKAIVEKYAPPPVVDAKVARAAQLPEKKPT